jgi:hypothetical protein
VEDQRPPPGDLTEKTPDEESVTETIVDEQAGQSATDEADGETGGDESDVEDVDEGAADDVESDNAITESEDGETESDETAAVGDEPDTPVRKPVEQSLTAALNLEPSLLEAQAHSPDLRESLAAYRERCIPHYTDR